MEITFSNDRPLDPMDGDYLLFGATADGQPVRCCITFSAIAPRSNNIETIKCAFTRKRDLIQEVARRMIEAAGTEKSEILITSLRGDRTRRSAFSREASQKSSIRG